MTAGVPLTVDFTARRVVCVGAGGVAVDKALPLLDAEADLVVVAPDAEPAIRQAADAGRLRWHARPYEPDDLRDALLVIAATAQERVNDRVVADAEEQGRLCVRCGGGTRPGTAAFPATVRRGDLTLAVSTGGASPTLARHVRAELEQQYGPEYGELAALLGEVRSAPAVREHLAALPPEQRRAAWRAVPLTDILTLLREGQAHPAKELAYACLCSSSD